MEIDTIPFRHFYIPISDEERKALKKAARTRGQKEYAFVRSAILAAIETQSDNVIPMNGWKR